MTRRYRYFAILAMMRTGSNLLEQIITGLPGAHCFGEAFNPHFIGGAKKTEMMGVTMQMRQDKE